MHLWLWFVFVAGFDLRHGMQQPKEVALLCEDQTRKESVARGGGGEEGEPSDVVCCVR